MDKLTRNVEIDNNAFKKVEAIIQSMTPQERNNPDLLNMSRKQRIARGCGRTLNDVNMFIKQFEQMRKMMHNMSKMPGFGSAGGPTGGGGGMLKRRR
jgi:signal recognition particle subunit SRP54